MFNTSTYQDNEGLTLSAPAAGLPPFASQFAASRTTQAEKINFSEEQTNHSKPKMIDYGPLVADDDAEESNDKKTKNLLFLSLFLQSNGNKAGEIDAGSISGFVEMLERAGLNVDPIKSVIEKVSGKSYADFSSDENKGHKYSVSDFYGKGRLDRTSFDSARAIRVAQSDNAGAGNCAKGVANILESMGIPVERGNATHWDQTLARKGWRRLEGVNPNNAPEGAVLVFNNDQQAGKGANNNGRGGQYGHVEIVAEGRNGDKVFVSDAVRNNWGGSVPRNFAGVYVYDPASMARTHSPSGPALHLG